MSGFMVVLEYQKSTIIGYNLTGRQHFNKIDIAGAYWQIEVEQDSKMLLIINIHKGL